MSSTTAPNRRKIDARRAGREKLNAYTGVWTATLQQALSAEPPVGEEFALLRELRRRERLRGGVR